MTDERLVFLLVALCAAVMGFAIQRGATCTVAAMDELVRQRRGTRLLSLGEAAAWVAAGLVLARWLGLDMHAPYGFEAGRWTLAGACLLGLGAHVNQACVFGAVARLGSGQWAYLFTPLGFLAGCAALPRLVTAPRPAALEAAGPLFALPWWTVLALAAWLAWRLARSWSGGPDASLPRRPLRQRMADAWSPHVATLVIGMAFCAMLLLAGAWTWPEALADLAIGRTDRWPVRLAWSLSLLAGAVLGGWQAGLLGWVPIRPAQALRCAVGGAMMGMGSLLIPGGNDGLILVGLPMFWPYAWIAFLAMCASIALAMWSGPWLARGWRSVARSAAASSG